MHTLFAELLTRKLHTYFRFKKKKLTVIWHMALPGIEPSSPEYRICMNFTGSLIRISVRKSGSVRFFAPKTGNRRPQPV